MGLHGEKNQVPQIQICWGKYLQITKLLRLKSKLLYHLVNQLTSVSSFSDMSVLKDLWDTRLADVYLSVNQNVWQS
jgi:hypothetical protein